MSPYSSDEWRDSGGFGRCKAVPAAGFESRWKARGQSFWTMDSCSTMSTDKSQPRWVGRSREDQKLAWEDQEGFNVAAVQSSCPQQSSCTTTLFTNDMKTPYSNLTAEVEWWHCSSRVHCCIHRILMSVRQRPQAPGQLFKARPIVFPIAPCWHAITQTVFTFGFCLVLFILLILCLTSLTLLHTSSRELILHSFYSSGNCVWAYVTTS